MDSKSNQVEDLHLFHDACNQDKLEEIKSYIEQKCSVNSHVNSRFGEEFSGYTPAHFAVKNKNIDALIYLLKNGADITEKSANNWTPVHLAYYNSATDLIFIMFGHSKINTYVNAVDSIGLTHLHICCALNIPVVEKFVANGVDINCSISLLAASDSGFTPLHFAVRKGNTQITRLLLKNGADYSLADKDGLTPLHLACDFDKISVGMLLVEAGADYTAKDSQNRLPLHYAFYRNYDSQLVDFLLEKISTGCNYTDCHRLSVFHMACLKNKAETVKHFLEQGCCPNERIIFNKNSNAESLTDQPKLAGQTPLHLAMYARSKSITEQLLLAGADINAEDDNGYSPLSYLYDPRCRRQCDSWFSYIATESIDELIGKHIRKLEAATLHVSEKVRKDYFARIICKRTYITHHNCFIELGMMQRVKIIKRVNKLNLRNILTKTQNEMSCLVKNKNVTNFLNPNYLNNLTKKFPIYGNMIKAQVNKGLRRAAMIKKAKESLRCLTGLHLPDLCSELILEYLRNEYLANLIDANIGIQT